MTRNLETADTIVKLVLALLIVLSYFSRVISGPLARIMTILAILVIAIFMAKVFLSFITRD
ncbi:MAG: hypothetical protein ACOYXT_28985 [Bacteroidota bacterium]